MYNTLLQRQIRKYLGKNAEIPETYRALFDAIDESYSHYESDRSLIERSMDLSSEELLDVNAELREQTERQELVLRKLKGALAALQLSEGESGPEVEDQDLVAVADLLHDLITRRKEMEERIQESESRFRLLAENSSDVVARYSPDGTCLYISPACYPLLGYQPEELIGHKGMELIHPGDRSVIENLQQDMIQKGGIFTLTSRTQRKDGKFIWLESTVRVITDSKTGEVIEVHTAGRDITDRIEAETELAKLSLVASKTDNAVLIVDKDGNIEWANDAFRRTTGYAVSEVMGKNPAYILLGPETDVETVETMQDALDAKQPFAGELLNYRKDGSRFWTLLTITPILNDEGEVARFISVQSDVTERRLTEEELRSTSTRLKTLIENLQVGILMEDESRRVAVVNHIFCDMFSIDSPTAALVGSNCLETTDNVKDLFLNPEGFVNRVLKLVKERMPVIGDELILKDGRTFERDYLPVFSEETYQGHLWQYRDITDRKGHEDNVRRLNEELRDKNRLLRRERDREKEHAAELSKLNLMKSEFVSSVSHELRTPLASIIGFAQTILSDPDLPGETQQEFLQIILDEGKRLAKLINDLLDLARIESGRAIIEKTEVELTSLVQRAIYAISMQASAKSIEVHTDLGEEGMLVEIDPDRVSQVLVNLLSNAIKFTPEGGEIGVKVRMVDANIEISVSDTGIGIPESEIPMLFNKFYRVHRPGLEIRGTGLGLAIVKHLVELHGGTIKVESKENVGSTFTIRIPR